MKKRNIYPFIKSGGVMRAIFTASLVFIALFFPLTVSAINLQGSSSTYLGIRENADNNRLVPLYEYLDFYIDDIDKGTMSFHFGGWFRQDLAEKSFDNRKFNSDLQYAYLKIKKGPGNMVLNIGRIYIFEGIASDQIDGLHGRMELPNNFDVSLYGGFPVETDFYGQSGDFLYGVRASHGSPGKYRLGISYLKENDNSSSFRQETGIDLWVLPLSKIEISGRSSYNIKNSGWMEHAYYLTLGPFDKLRINSDVSWIKYDNYFDSATTSAFRLQQGIIDPEDRVLILGFQAEYPVLEKLSASVDYKNFSYKIAGSADYYGLRLSYAMSDAKGVGLSFHRMNGETERLGYIESRAYFFTKFKGADINLDVININYDKAIYGVNNAYSSALTLGYNVGKNSRTTANIDYSHNPDFDSDIRVLIKFIHNFEFKGVKIHGI